MFQNTKADTVSISLKLMEQSINKSLDGCKLWGDLDYTKEDFKRIHKMLKTYVEVKDYDEDFYDAFKRFPYSFITDFIGFIIYEYDGGGIWPFWLGKFGVEANAPLQSKIGQLIRHIFEVKNLEIVVDGGHLYITPILYQAGISNFTLRRLYDLIYYTVDYSNFDEMEFYEEVTGYRSYLLDSTGVRYFKDVSRAMDLISEVRSIIETMDSYSSESEVPLNLDYDERFVKEFFNWKQIRKEGNRRSEKANYYYVSPKIYFDDLKGVSLRLPAQIINDESVDIVSWEIECEDTSEILLVSRPVYFENRLMKIEEALIPVPPSKSYKVTMLDQDNYDNEIYKPWTVSGLDSEVPYIIFATDSRSQKIPQLSQKVSLLIRHKDVLMTNNKEINIHQRHDLPIKWKEYRAELITPKEETHRVQLSYIGTYRFLDIKREVSFSLVQLSTLFDEKYYGTAIPVYVSLPVIEIEESIERMEALYYKTKRIMIRNKLSNHKEECQIGECKIRIYDDSIRVFLPERVKKVFENHYGEYEIKMQMDKNMWVEPFYLVPEINYQGELIHDELNPYLNSMSLKIKENEVVTYEFDKDNLIETLDSAGERWIRVFSVRAKAFIRGVMKVELPELNKTIQIPFRKRTGKVEWKFWNEEDNSETNYGSQFFEVSEIEKGNWSCFISLFGDEDEIQIALESAKEKEVLQSRRYSKSRNGIIKIPMNGFIDTIKSEKLPQKIIGYIENEDRPICLGVIRKISVLENLQYRKKGDISYVIWDNYIDLSSKTIRLESVSDPDATEIKFEVDRVRSLKFGELMRYGMTLPSHPDEGLYMVHVEDEEDDFFFEEEDEVFAVDQDKFLQVLQKISEDNIGEKYHTIGQWARAYLSSLADTESINVLHNVFLQQIKRVEYSFLDEDLEVFIRLVMVVLDTKYLKQETASILREFFSEVNIRFITNKDRAVLLKRILKGNFSKDDFIKMEYELQLFMVERNSQVQLAREEIRKLWQLDEKLAILVILRGVAENSQADTVKILNHLNAPMIRKIIEFKPVMGCQTQEWMDCFENVVTGKCNCANSGFPATENFWGDIGDFQDIIVSNKNELSLRKLSELPSDGYEFLGSNYLSLCYRWIEDNNYKDKHHWKKALDYEAALSNVAHDNLKKYNNILKVLHKRIDGNSMSFHRFFYSVGVGAILEASGKKESPMKSDLRRIHRFWDHAFRAFPKLVMRDLIISELYMKFN